jgi:transcriptional regulator with XRE-family HTH domain
VEGDLQRTFGNNLRIYRKAKKLTQEQLASDVFGYHRTYISSIERGKRNLSLKVVERLAAAIDADPLTLLTPVEGDPPKRS